VSYVYKESKIWKMVSPLRYIQEKSHL